MEKNLNLGKARRLEPEDVCVIEEDEWDFAPDDFN